jgi:hypothetical protein
MSDCIDDFRALKEVRRQEREDGWAKRGEWLTALGALGLRAEIINEPSRQCRVWVPGGGWFDFWPSSGRWQQGPHKGKRRGLRGVGLEGLLAAVSAAQ